MSTPKELSGLEAYLDSASALIGLEIARDHRPGVLRFLTLAAEMAATFDTVPWDGRQADLAPVYRLPGWEAGE